MNADLSNKLTPQQREKVRRNIQHETYDVRVISKNAVPPTKVQTLVNDIWTLATIDIGVEKATPCRVTPEQVRAVIRFYETSPWRELRGYRPWTHWSFIHSLDEIDRETLSTDVSIYIHTTEFERSHETDGPYPRVPSFGRSVDIPNANF